ncbi:peptidase [Nocardia thailandica]
MGVWMYRKLVLTVAAVCVVAGCGGSEETTSAAAGAGAPDAAFWSAAATTEQQRAAVAGAARQIDVCALLPRDALAEAGAVQSVTGDSLYSCDAKLAGGTTLTWSSMVLPDPVPADRGTEKKIGDVAVRTVPGTGCGVTARYPSGAAIYLGATTTDPAAACGVAEKLMPGMLKRWVAAPAQGTAPETVRTALLGADPCAVRDKLSGTEDLGQVQLTACGFRYKGEDVVVNLEYRARPYVEQGRTAVPVGSRTAYRSEVPEGTAMSSYAAVVGPELPGTATPEATGGPVPTGPVVPVIDVIAGSNAVAEEVLGQELALFPAQ